MMKSDDARTERIRLVVIFLVGLKLTLHALYVPVFEGPDEPFHLARVVALLESGLSARPDDAIVSESIVATAKDHPCGPDLRRSLGCQAFEESGGAEFNILAHERANHLAATIDNYEAHQPPLYYGAGAVVLAVVERAGALFGWESGDVFRLLVMRLFSVLLITVALAGPLALIARERGAGWFAVVALALLLPGAAESLARCANDAGVFLWAAIVMWAIERRIGTAPLVLLVAVGPLIKLTALPVALFAVAWLFVNRSVRSAALAAMGSAAVIPVQWMRGFRWGGTVELNARASTLGETWSETLFGLARSSYTFAKTTVWLGEWSFFRSPVWVLLVIALYVLVFALLVRRRHDGANRLPDVLALSAALGLVVTWFVSHRLFWGEWGGVGGWYAWGWLPWVAVSGSNLIDVPERHRRLFLSGAIALLVVVNGAWIFSAHRLYG